MSATWTAITDPQAITGVAASWTSSLPWTVPNATGSGYCCVRGVVTDTANQTMTVLNAYGVK
jgi:hypothetical protein